MRDATARHWHRWRLTQPRPATTTTTARSDRPHMPTTDDKGRNEKPGPDGIRHELVARVRREIAAGTYDTDERWFAAEAELLRRIEEER